jgi:hypothetical protein
MTAPEPGRHRAPGASTGLRFRVYVDGEHADEGWVYSGDAADDATIDRLWHVCDEAGKAGRDWRLEVYDPDLPVDGDNPLRIGPESFVVPVMAVSVVIRSRPSPYGHPN